MISRSRVTVLAVAVLLLSPLAAVTAAESAPGRTAVRAAVAPVPTRLDRPDPGRLSPRLAALASPALRTASRAAQARALSLAATGAGSLVRQDGRVLVDVHFTGTNHVDALRAAGARVVHVSGRYHTVTVSVAPAALRAVAAVRGVRNVAEVLTPMTSGTGVPAAAVAPAGCPSGGTVSEGDTQLNAATARSTLGVDGTGVTVGVLSDSYNHNAGAATTAPQDVTSGDLPGSTNPCGHSTPVTVVDDTAAGGEDEGRGMLQIVHDLAPGANLSFATAFTSETGFADNIRALKNAGAKVIVDDVTYFDEPFFQDGPVAVAVNDVTAAGVSYFSSAANNNIISGGHDVASYEAPAYRNAACPAALAGLTQCHDFDPGPGTDTTYGISVANGRTLTLDLQWAQPWNGVTTDLDAYLLNSSDSVVASSQDPNVTSQEPFEFVQWTNSTGSTQTVRLAVNRYVGTGGGDTKSPRLKVVLLENGAPGVFPTEYTTSSGGDLVGPTIFGHNGTAKATSVAAIPYDNSNTAETYSSRGPLALYYGPVTGAGPAAPITPQTLDKPDLAATDCGVTTFFAGFDGSNWRFCGTSAAAPHAAAVAALALQYHPAATVQQIRTAQTSTAVAVGAFGQTAAGAGRLDALAAAQALDGGSDTTPPTATMLAPTKTLQFTRSIGLQWSGNDAGSGVKDFTVQVRKAPYNGGFGSWSTVAGLSDTAATSSTYVGRPGTTYCFRVRARDNALNTSAFAASKCTEIPVDDTTPKPSTGWTRKTGQPTFGGTLSVATRRGATLTLANVHARQVGLMARSCSGCGKVKISFAGRSATFDLSAATAQNSFGLLPAFSSVKTGTLTLTVVTRRKKVQIDGVIANLSAATTTARGVATVPRR